MARPDRFTPSCSSDWGAQSLAAANADGGLEGRGTLLGQDLKWPGAWRPGSTPNWTANPPRTSGGILRKNTGPGERRRRYRRRLFTSGLHSADGLPGGLVVTLPRVRTVAQMQPMAYTVSRLEEVQSLPREGCGERRRRGHS